jgi:AraC-like DNA-binding protein
MTSIKLFRGRFGHVSVLNVASDLVTHAHPEAHIIIWLEGAGGTMTIGDKTVSPGPGTAAGVNSLVPHSHAFSDAECPGVFLAFYIEPDWAGSRYGLPTGSPLFSGAAIALDDRLQNSAMQLHDHLRGEWLHDVMVEYEIERLLDRLVAAARALRGPRGRRHGAAYDFRVRKAVELMQSNICERICFDALARKVGMSRAHFFALFKEQTRLTPNVYWNMLRMEEARRQLQSSQDPLMSVACNLGFTTQGNFSRFFRDHVGVPPIQYREAARGPH